MSSGRDDGQYQYEDRDEDIARDTRQNTRNTRDKYKWLVSAEEVVDISTLLSYGTAGVAELATENSMLSSYLLQALPYFGIADAAVGIVDTCVLGELTYYSMLNVRGGYLYCLLQLASNSQLMYFSIKALGLPLASAGFGLLCNGFAIKAAADLLMAGGCTLDLYLQLAAAKAKEADSSDVHIKCLEKRIADNKMLLVDYTLRLAAWGLLALGHPAGLAFLAGILLIRAVTYANNRFFKSSSASGSKGFEQEDSLGSQSDDYHQQPSSLEPPI